MQALSPGINPRPMPALFCEALDGWLPTSLGKSVFLSGSKGGEG